MTSPYWSQTSSTATAPTFSPASLASQVDAALAMIPRDQHGRLVLSIDQSRKFTAGAAGKADAGPFVLGAVIRVQKKPGEPWAADLNASVSFVLPNPLVMLAFEPIKVRGLRDLYVVLRHTGNGRGWALAKALLARAGASVPLLPADTVL